MRCDVLWPISCFIAVENNKSGNFDKKIKYCLVLLFTMQRDDIKY